MLCRAITIVATCATAGLSGLAARPLPTLPLRWTTLDPMPLPIFDAGAGLSDDWIVVSGGFGEDLSTTPAIQVRSESRGWRPIGTQLRESRARHTQTTLDDGRVLVVGGVQGSLRPDAAEAPIALASAEVFHPLMAGSDFIALGEPLVGHSAHLLPDGRVAVIGGSWVRFFDPEFNGFTEAIRLKHERHGHASVLWNRKVYPEPESPAVADANRQPDYDTVEQELAIGSVPTARGASIGATMEPQKVAIPKVHSPEKYSTRLVLLVIGGDDDATMEEVDLQAGTSRLWETRLTAPIAEACATVTMEGRVLLIGGVNTNTGESLATLSWLDAHETVSDGPDLDLAAGAAAATCFVDSTDGSVIMFGGEQRDAHSIKPVVAGRMMRRGGKRVFTLPIPAETAIYARRNWIRLNDRQVAAVGGYRYVDAATATAENIAPGVYVRGLIDVVRLPSPIGGD